MIDGNISRKELRHYFNDAVASHQAAMRKKKSIACIGSQSSVTWNIDSFDHIRNLMDIASSEKSIQWRANFLTGDPRSRLLINSVLVTAGPDTWRLRMGHVKSHTQEVTLRLLGYFFFYAGKVIPFALMINV